MWAGLDSGCFLQKETSLSSCPTSKLQTPPASIRDTITNSLSHAVFFPSHTTRVRNTYLKDSLINDFLLHWTMRATKKERVYRMKTPAQSPAHNTRWMNEWMNECFPAAAYLGRGSFITFFYHRILSPFISMTRTKTRPRLTCWPSSGGFGIDTHVLSLHQSPHLCCGLCQVLGQGWTVSLQLS